jgi:hypothetical protein
MDDSGDSTNVWLQEITAHFSLASSRSSTEGVPVIKVRLA